MAQSLDQMNIPPPGGPTTPTGGEPIKGGDPDQSEGGSGGSNLVRKEEWGSIADILKSIENTSKRSGGARPVPTVGVPVRMPPLTENIQTPPLAGERGGGQGMQQLDHLLRLMEQMCALRRQNHKLREHAQYLTAIKTLQDIRNEQLLHDCSCEVHRNLSDHSGSSSPMEHNHHGNLESFSEPESHAGEGDDETEERKYRSNRPERRVGRAISREAKGRSMKKRSKSLDPFGDEAVEGVEEETVKERGRPGIFSKFEKMKEKLTNRRGSVKRRSGVKGYDEEGKKYDAELGVPMDGVETKSEDSGFYQATMDDSLLPMLHRFDLPQREEVEFSDGEPEEVFDPRQLPLSQRAELRQARKVSDVSTGSSSEDFNESKRKHRKYKSSRQPHGPTSGASLSDHNESSPADVHRARRRSRFSKASSVHEFNNSSLDTDPSPSRLPDPIPMTPPPHHGSVRAHPRLEQSLSMDTEMPEVSGRLGSQLPQMGSSVDSKLGQKRKHGRKKPLVDFSDPSLSSSPEAKGGDHAPRSSSPPEKKRSKETAKVVPGDTSAGGKQAMATDMMTMYENIQANLSEDFLSKLEDWNKKKQKEGTDITKQSSVESTSSEPPTVVPMPTNELPHELLQGLSEEFSKKMADWDNKKKKGGVGPSPKGDRRQKGAAKEKKEGGAKEKKEGSGAKEKKDGGAKDKKEKTKKEEKTKKSEETPPPKRVAEGEKLAHTTRKVTVVENEEGLVKLEGASKDFEEKYREWEKMHRASSELGGAKRREGDDEGDVSFSPPKSSYPLPAFRNISDSNSSLATPVIVEPNLIPRQLSKHEMASQAEFPDDRGGGDGEGEGDAGEAAGGDEPISTLERRNSLLAEKLKRKDVNLRVVQSELLVVQEQLEKMAGWKGDEKRHSTCSSIGETALEAELIEIRSQVQELEEKIQSRAEEEPEGTADEKEKDNVDGTAEVKSEEASNLPSKLEAQVQTIQEEEPSLPDEAEKTQESAPAGDTSSTTTTTEALTKSLQQRENLIKFLSLEVERQRREINFLRSEGMGGAHFKRAKSFSARDRNFDSKAMQVMDIPMGKSLARRRKDSPNSTPSLSNADSSDQRNRESLSITTESTQSLETLHISAEDIRMEDLGSQLTLDQDQRIEEEVCLPEPIQEVSSPDHQTKESPSPITPDRTEEASNAALPPPDVTQVTSHDAEMEDAARSETTPSSTTEPMDVSPEKVIPTLPKPSEEGKSKPAKDIVPSERGEGSLQRTDDSAPKVKDVPPTNVKDSPLPKSNKIPASEPKDNSESKDSPLLKSRDVTVKPGDVPAERSKDARLSKLNDISTPKLKDSPPSKSKDVHPQKSDVLPSKLKDEPSLSEAQSRPSSEGTFVGISSPKNDTSSKPKGKPLSKAHDLSSPETIDASASNPEAVSTSTPEDVASRKPTEVSAVRKDLDKSKGVLSKPGAQAEGKKDTKKNLQPSQGESPKTDKNKPILGKQHPLDARIPSSIVAQKISSLKEKTSSASDSDSKDEKTSLRRQRPEPRWKTRDKTADTRKSTFADAKKSRSTTASDSDSKDEKTTVQRQRPQPKWKTKEQTAVTNKSAIADAKKSLVSDRAPKDTEEGSRQSRPRTRQNFNTQLKKTPPRDAKVEADLKETLSSMRGGLKKVQPTDRKPPVPKATTSAPAASTPTTAAPKLSTSASKTASTPKTSASTCTTSASMPKTSTASKPKTSASTQKTSAASLQTSSPTPKTSASPTAQVAPTTTVSATKSWRERMKKEGDHALESDQDSSIRSDTDSRRSHEPASSSKRRDSSDSVSSSRRSSPATRLIEKYDPRFAKNLAANRVEVSSVSDLKAKFAGGSKSEDDGSGQRGRKERPKAGSVKMLSQAFAVSSAVGTDSPKGGAVGKLGGGGGTGQSSYRSTPSISPASSCGSLPGSQVSNRIKRMQERRTQSVKDSTPSSKASTEATRPTSTSQVTLKPVPKIQEPLAPKNASYRSSLPNLSSVRARFEQPDSGGSGNTGLRVRQKSGSTGKLSFTVSVTESKTTTERTTEVKPGRARTRTPRLVAVIETPGNDKGGTETVTVRLRSPSARRSSRTTAGSPRDGSKPVNELHISEPEIATVPRDTELPPPEDMSASAPSLRTVSKSVTVTESKVTQRKQSSEQKALSSSDPQIEDGDKAQKMKSESDSVPSEGRSQKTSDNTKEVSRSEPAVDKASQSEETASPKSPASKSETSKEGNRRERSQSSEKRVRSPRGKENIEQSEAKEDSSKTSKSESISESTEKSTSKSKSSTREGRKSKGGKGKKGGGGGGGSSGGNGGQQKSRKAKQHEPSSSRGSMSGKEGKATGKGKRTKGGNKRREQEANSRNTQDTERHSQGNDSSGSRSSLDNYPDLLAETPRVRESGGVLIDDNGNSSKSHKKKPRQAVAASALQGAAAAIGHALPDPATGGAEFDDLDGERRSRKDKTRRGRMLSKADRLSKLDLFRRARSVDTSKASRDRSPSLERGPGRSGRSSSMDRSKKRDPSPKGKGGKDGGQRAGWKRILRASNFCSSQSIESLTSLYFEAP